MDKNGAVIYCRVSTKEQAENFSLATQEGTCREFCDREGLVVLKVFSEAESARTVDRAQFQAMQEFCVRHRKEVAAVVVYSVSRFSRQTSDHLTVKLLLQKLGIDLRSVTEPIDPSPTGRFTETVMSAYSQLENELRALRTKDGMMAAVQSGKWVHRAPLGYVNANVPGGLLKDPARADLICTAFELFVGGDGKTEILKKVTDLGLRTQTNTELSIQSLDNLLRNPVYGGLISIPKWGLEVPGRFAPIIDGELLARVKARLSEPQVERSPEVSEEFPLRVFVRCSGCGQGITGSFSTGRRGGKYPYYFCRVKGCHAVSFKRLDLEVKFLTLLDSLRVGDQFRPLLKEAVRAVWTRKKTQHDNVLAQARKQISELQAWQEQVVRAWIAEKISKEIYDDQMEKVGKQLQAAGLIEGEAMLDLAEIELLLDFADWMLNHCASVWASASWENKQRIQTAVFPNGLMVSPDGFRTPEDASLFFQLHEREFDASVMASPGGFEPPLPP